MDAARREAERQAIEILIGRDPRDYTTLQLCRAVARAARQAPDEESATQAVGDTLYRCEAWFCRWQDPEDGPTITTPFEVQPDFLYLLETKR